MAIVKLRETPPQPDKGKLVRIPTGRKGTFVLMYEEVARAKGLLPPLPEVKAEAPKPNKARRKSENKAG